MKKHVLLAKMLMVMVFTGMLSWGLLSSVYAQVGLYSFAESTETYAQITGTTSTATGDDGSQNGVAIGFTFNFGGTDYTTFSINTNGFIRLGANIGASPWTNSIANANSTQSPVIAAFWDDNNLSTGTIRYTTTGSAPNRVLTVDWNQTKIGGTGSTGGASNNMQIRLYETTNNIEMVYGSTFTTTNTVSAFVGINNAGSFVSVTPGNPSTSSNATQNHAINNTVMQNLAGKKLTFSPPQPCSGTPTPGNTISSVGSLACTGANFTLSLQNATLGTGVTYQWQTSPNGTDWTNAGPNASTWTTNQSSETHYRCIVTCNGNDGISTPVVLGINTPFFCHCASTGTSGSTQITNVTISGLTTLNNTTTGNAGYADFTSLIPTVSAFEGSNVSFSITATSDPGRSIFVDWNNNGVFEVPGERVFTSAAYVTGASAGNFTVPLGTPLGDYRIRVVVNWNATTPAPCNANINGETEDYTFKVVAVPTCYVPTNLQNNPLSLTSMEHSWSLPISGTPIGYEWAVTSVATPPANGTFTNLLTATSVGLVTGDTYYLHVRSDCGNGDLSDWVTTPFELGYCEDPTYSLFDLSCANNFGITNVTLGDLNNTSACNQAGPNFTLYNTPQANLLIGETYPLSVSLQGTTSFITYVKVWIDFNQNGIFDDAGELIFNSGQVANIPGPFGTNYTIPNIAPGQYRMRVRSMDADENSCSGDGIVGEVEDYLLNITLPPLCSGMPNAAVASISAPMGCASSNIILTATGATVDLGIEYQWQYSPNGFDTWTDIVGANSTVLNTTASASPGITYYRMLTTCTATNDVNNTNVVSFETSNSSVFCQNYCESPLYSLQSATCINNFGITNVTLGDLNNSSACNQIDPNFTLYYVPQANLMVGETYPLSVSLQGTTAFATWVKVWIDFNQNGSFDDAGELIYNSGNVNSVAGPFGTNYTIPNIAPGQYRMRVRSMDADENSCSGDGIVGEVEDYLLNITLPPLCSGMPNAAVASISAPMGCTSSNIILTATGATVDLGIEYQWQSSPNGIDTWTDIVGANSTVLNTTASASPGITYYRMLTTCTATNDVNNTNVVSFETSTSSIFCQNYCETPVYSSGSASCGFNFGITNVTYADLNNNSACNGTAPNFTFYTSPQVNVVHDTPYPLSVSLQGTTTFITYVKVWIDFNQNGSFDDAGELIFNSGQVANIPGPFGTNITIPNTVTPGQYRMRVRSMDNDVNSCSGDGIIGEVEDYIVNISALPACSGTPAPGNTISTLPFPCPTEDFTLSVQNSTTGSAVSYQWQTSSNGVDWTDAVGSPDADTWTTTHAAATWYRCVVTCTASNESTGSNGLLVGSSPCYCVAQYSSGKTAGDLISNVEIPGTTLANNSGTAQVNPAYTYFTGPTNTAELIQGGSYNVTISVGTWGDQHLRAWIDYNDDGVFDDTESIGTAIIAPGAGNTGPFPPAVFNVNLSNSAPLGTHRMRIRSVWSTGNTLHLTMDPCISYGFGETEDYDITIVAPVTTQLQPSSCGATNVQMSDVLGAIQVPNGGYRFRIIGANDGSAGWNGNTFILDRPVRNFRFSHVPGSLWGETYSVEVAVGDGFGNYGPYGASCNVTLASLPPTTQLQSSQCNITDVSQTTFLIANQVNNAAGYRFRIIGANNGAQGWSGNTFILDRPVRNFRFSMVPGVIWGETYSVEVAVLSTDNVTYGAYGTACNVTLQGTPTTALQSSQCGITNVAQNTALFANTVNGAAGYRFRVVGANDASQGWVVDTYILDRPVRNFKFNMIPGVLQGEEYEVQVAVMDADGNYGAYGSVCTITLAGAPDFVINDDNDIFFDDKTMNVVEFGASASHNPFTTDFGIQVLNANDSEAINVVIYDMSGKLIESNTVNPMDIESARFGKNLAAGMYMVTVVQGSNQAVIRQVKN